MAFIEGSSDGTFNGVTPVTVVAAPAAATRRIIKTIVVFNRDTAPVTVTLRFISSGGTRHLTMVTLAVNDTLIWEDALVLDAVTKSMTAVMSGAPATTQPDFVSTYADAT